MSERQQSAKWWSLPRRNLYDLLPQNRRDKKLFMNLRYVIPNCKIRVKL